jgi:hypothetical protein
LKEAEKQGNLQGISLVEICRTINERLSVLLGSSYAFGHHIFARVQNFEQLVEEFSHICIPSLLGWCQQDLQKLSMIIGKDFIEQIPAEKYFKNAVYSPGLRGKKYLKLKEPSSWSVQFFKKIYK